MNNKFDLRILSLLAIAPMLAFTPACADDEDIDEGMTGTDTANQTGTDSMNTNTGGTDSTGNTNDTSTGDDTDIPVQCADPSDPNAYVTINSDLTGNTDWTCDKIYILDTNAIVFVRGGTLNIQAGTLVLGQPGSALVIEKDAQINAVGTASQPIVFTSAKPAGMRARGDWGGMVLLGLAVNNQGINTPAEGFPVPPVHGGNNPAHSCGTMKYVRVEWAGNEITSGNELNGITFYSCGTGTVVDYVQSHMGKDDGIEWFGGGFDAKHLVVTGAADDSLDIDLGFSGKLQHIFVHQDPTVGDNAFEISNNGDAVNQTPTTKPMLANVTVVGSGATGVKSKGLTLKEGTSIELYNSIVAGTTGEAVLMTHAATQTMLETMNAKAAGNIFFGSGTPMFRTSADGSESSGETWLGMDLQNWFTPNNFIGANPALPSAVWTTPNVVPAAGGATSMGAATLPAGFDPTTYIGAEMPGTATPWTAASWINYSTN